MCVCVCVANLEAFSSNQYICMNHFLFRVIFLLGSAYICVCVANLEAFSSKDECGASEVLVTSCVLVRNPSH